MHILCGDVHVPFCEGVITILPSFKSWQTSPLDNTADQVLFLELHEELSEIFCNRVRRLWHSLSHRSPSPPSPHLENMFLNSNKTYISPQSCSSYFLFSKNVLIRSYSELGDVPAVAVCVRCSTRSELFSLAKSCLFANNRQPRGEPVDYGQCRFTPAAHLEQDSRLNSITHNALK